jgi:hypothetical protein
MASVLRFLFGRLPANRRCRYQLLVDSNNLQATAVGRATLSAPIGLYQEALLCLLAEANSASIVAAGWLVGKLRYT